MKTDLFVIAAVAVFGASAMAFAGDIKLPAPQKTGGPTVFAAIDQRGSAGHSGFPSGNLDRQDLSTILWAASGNNRDGAKWTVPMGMGRPPYCKIYVTTAEGVFLYDWKAHELKQVSAENVGSRIPMQDFAKNAPAVLYIVGDNAALADLPRQDWVAEWCGVLAGAMSQNIYLASQGVGVGTRLIYSINREEAARLLKLGPKDTPFFAMPMGKK
ncbi:MAG: nitroreductase family protein [Planctomycetota bacterium]|jgi:hypothetical protein|nr:nitroreductase family protein [Planctomycetota bacterium]